MLTKTVMMATTPPQAGWFEEVHLVTKTVMMATSPHQAGWFEDVPPGDKDCDDGGHSSSGWLV